MFPTIDMPAVPGLAMQQTSTMLSRFFGWAGANARDQRRAASLAVGLNLLYTGQRARFRLPGGGERVAAMVRAPTTTAGVSFLTDADVPVGTRFVAVLHDVQWKEVAFGCVCTASEPGGTGNVNHEVLAAVEKTLPNAAAISAFLRR